jgi:NodT family efflux transporter outer membrane factor (OMF) lipoprotein
MSSIVVRACLGGVVSALLWGCAVGPHYHRPALPANASYAPEEMPTTIASAPVHGGEAQRLVPGGELPFRWWELFRSAAVNSLVSEALGKNSSIAAARAAVAKAQECVYAQRGFFFPVIDATYQLERHKVAGNLLNSETPGVQQNGSNLLPRREDLSTFPHNQPLFYTFHTAELTVSFVPDVFGGNRRQMESLEAQRDAQKFALEATYVTLVTNVVAAAIQEASLRAQIGATEQIIRVDTRSLEILRQQLRVGFAMQIDVDAQEAALALVRTTLPPLREQLEQTRDLLRALVGRLPSSEVAQINLDDLQLPGEIPLSVPAKLIEQRPDVRAAESQLHAANAQIGVAVAAMLPQFSITGTYAGNATEFSQMFSSGGPFWSIFAAASQPLFHGGTLWHQKHAAERAMQQAAAQYASTVLSAYQNVADSLRALLCDSDALAADLEAENAAKVTLDLTRKQQETGYVSYLAVSSAEVAWQQALLQRVQAQAARFGDTVALFQALGGGGWNREGDAL